jgi:hypothetical protein
MSVRCTEAERARAYARHRQALARIRLSSSYPHPPPRLPLNRQRPKPAERATPDSRLDNLCRRATELELQILIGCQAARDAIHECHTRVRDDDPDIERLKELQRSLDNYSMDELQSLLNHIQQICRSGRAIITKHSMLGEQMPVPDEKMVSDVLLKAAEARTMLSQQIGKLERRRNVRRPAVSSNICGLSPGDITVEDFCLEMEY